MIARMEQKMVVYLSHRPKLYALVGGMGMILFWRGVWHSVDQVHELFSLGLIATSIDLVTSPWRDGPLSLVWGLLFSTSPAPLLRALSATSSSSRACAAKSV